MISTVESPQGANVSWEVRFQLLKGTRKSFKSGFQRTGIGCGHEPVLGGESVVGGRRHEEHGALREAMGYRRGEEIQGRAFAFHSLMGMQGRWVC